MEYFTDPNLIKPTNVISLDTEFTELDVKKAGLLSISIGFSSKLAGVFSVNDLPKLAPLINGAKRIYVQNGKVDWYILHANGMEIDRTKFVDCMLLEHLIDENVKHSLGEMVNRYYQDTYKSVFWDTYRTYQDAPVSEQIEYEKKDACYTFALGERFLQEVGDSELIEHVHRLYWALSDTEFEGIKVDTGLMEETKRSMGAQIQGYLPRMREQFNDHCTIWELNKWAEEIGKRATSKGKDAVKKPVFSFGSDAQIRWLLYEALNCPVTEKTKTKQPKTDYDTIKILSETRPELNPILEYKEIKTIYATFVEGLLERVESGNIYPSFNVNGTRNAGRISHANPNMGNMPKDGPIRNFFIPSEGHSIIGADYSQLEVVIEANLTNDKSLLKIILEGASKHDITAQGLSISRDNAKTLNFALQYGAGVHKVAKLLEISHRDAQDVFNRYWQLYAGVKSLKDKTAKEIEDQGYVTTLFGRRRHFPKPTNEYEKSRFERQGYNAIVQGTGADCTNRATWIIGEGLRKENLGRLWFSVHDEVVCEVKKEHVSYAVDQLIYAMENPSTYLKLKYPLTCKTYGPLERWAKT